MAGMHDAPGMYRFLKRVLPPIMKPMFHMRIEGLEHVPPHEPVIFAANHLSFIDSIFLPVSVDRPIYFLGKADYFESWRTRWFFRGAGVVPVHRQGGDKGMDSLLTGVEILRSGDAVGIYPEGTRSPDGRLYRGKTGPVRMALMADVPVVPVGMIGTDRAMPTGRYIPQRHPVAVRFGRPLDFSRYRGRDEDPFVLRSATDELMYEIMMLSGQEYVDEYAAKVKSGDVELDVEMQRPPATGGGSDSSSEGSERRAS